MPRILIAILAAGLAGPPLVVGLTGAGVPWRVAAAGCAIAAAVAIWRTREGAGELAAAIRRHPALIVLAVALAAATYYNVRLSRFMYDGSDGSYSVFPSRQFFRQHTCLSSYTEAARLAPTGVNVYETQHYVPEPRPGEYTSRFIGVFEVDIFQYPPPFLVLPRAAMWTGLDFLDIRRLWFGIQGVVLFLGMAMLAAWVGGARGALLLALSPLIWLAPTTRVGLQIGNYQLTAFPLAVMAMIAFDRGRAAAGGLALGFNIVSKIFPGILGLLLLAQRNWRAIWWSAAWGVVITIAAWAAVGTAPFVDFVRYQLPRIESGQAFFWIEFPSFPPLNQSVYGLVTKLRALGVPFTGPEAAQIASSAYAFLLLPIAALGAWRLSRVDAEIPDQTTRRLAHAQVWIALVSLASFRSPFVPDAYGLVGTLWLLALLAVARPLSSIGWSLIALAGAAFAITLDGGVLADPPPTWAIAATLVIQLAALAVNLYAVTRPQTRRQAFRLINRGI